MKNQQRLLLALFLFVSFLHLLFIAMDCLPGAATTKPLLLTLLAFWFYFRTKPNFTKFSKFLLFALIMSFWGDVFLLFNGETFFLLGLGSFLMAHLLYIAAFRSYPRFNEGLAWKNPAYMIPFMLYLMIITCHLWPNLGGMKIPVFVYSTVITLMALSAANMTYRAERTASNRILLGAVLFVISDSVLAINKFKSDIAPGAVDHLIIMASYVAAQYLLATGCAIANDNA